MDELERELARLGGPRPLPEPVRQRLEAALTGPAAEAGAAAGAAAAGGNPLAGIDGPRPLPAALDRRLMASLAVEAAPLPRRLRRRVEAALAPTSGGRRPALTALAAAAAVVLLAATVATLVRAGGSGGVRKSAAAARGPATTAGGSGAEVAAPGSADAPGGQVSAGSAGGAGVSAGAGAAGASPAIPAPSGAGAAARGAIATPSAGTRGPPPPFAFDPDATGSPAPAAGPQVRVGVVGGDPAEEAGFRAYVQLLNQAGGAGGHPFVLVPVSPSGPGRTAVTVNLSGTPVAGTTGPPGWVSGPLLESLAGPEAVTRGDVFDLASPPERQAHLAADAVFPTAAPGATAVVYQAPSGVLGDQVPAAFDAVLRARNVTPVHVVYRAGDPLAPVHADAVLLSLDTSTSRDWLDRARAAAVAPVRGVAGLYPLLDAGLLSRLPAGTRVESPYLLASGAEAAAMRKGTGLAPSDALTHGWVTAKALAVAVWQSGAVDPASMAGALAGLKGYADGFAPPYETRAGSNARQPEGVLFTVQTGAFATAGGFRTDPF